MAFLDETISLLSRTPATLNVLLRDLPAAWTQATEGPNTWSPYDVLGHLIHGEHADWIPRLEIILTHGPSRPFDPFDREAMFRESAGKSLPQLLDEFALAREHSLARLAALSLTESQLALTGTHPKFGPVTAGQLLATWLVHDLTHLNQINRAMAKRYSTAVGPWVEFLSILA